MTMHSLLLLVCALSILLPCNATNYTWNLPTGGNWADATSWTPNGVPGANDYALFVNSGSSCQLIDSSGKPGCLISLGSSAVTVLGLVSEDYAGITIGTGSLTTTTYSVLIDIAFYGLTLVTKGYTQYDSGTNNLQVYNSKWTTEGTTLVSSLDWEFTTSTVNNTGNFNITNNASPYQNDNDDYSKSIFYNSGQLTMTSGDGRWSVSLVSTGTTTVDGTQGFWGSDVPTVKQFYTTWTGIFNILSTAQVMFYTGQHNFNAGLTYNVPSVVFQGMQGSSFFMNVSFNLPITIPYINMVDPVSVAFNKPVIINNLEFDGGWLIGASNSIVIKNLTGGCASPTGDYCPVFGNNYTTVMNASVDSNLNVATGINVLFNGTLYSEVLIFDSGDDGLGGTITIGPEATFYLYTFDDDLTHRHTSDIPVIVHGSIVALPPLSGLSCIGNGGWIQWRAGGICAGTFVTMDCGNNGVDYDVDLCGGWVYNTGTNLTGYGSFGFNGWLNGNFPSPNHVFNAPLTVNFLILIADPVFILNAPLTVNNLLFDGGIITTTNDANTITLSPKNYHSFSNSYNRVLTLDGVIMTNLGALDATGGPLGCVNGGVLINNGTMNVSSSGLADAYLINYGNISSNYDGLQATVVFNYGLITTGSVDAASAVDFRGDSDNMTLDNTFSVLSLNVFSLTVYDVFDLFNINYCRFGGKLIINFIQPVSVPGQQTVPFTPAAGDVYPLITMPGQSYSETEASMGGCECQFASVATTGLDTSKYKIGLQYDASAGSSIGEVVVNVKICGVSDAVCSSITRVNASCGAIQPPPKATSTSGTSSSGTTSSKTPTGSSSSSGTTSSGTSSSGTTSSKTPTGSSSSSGTTSSNTPTGSTGGSTSTTGKKSNDSNYLGMSLISFVFLFAFFSL